MPTKTVIATRTTKRTGKAHPPPAMPRLSTQAASLLNAATDTLKRILIGAPLRRTPEHQAACLAVCHACEAWLPEAQRCSKCGCFGSYKAWLAAAKCPLDKWPNAR